MKEIYNQICYSLHTDDVMDEKCLKRCFWVNDWINGNYVKIFVCAEYFRLVYDSNKNKCPYFTLDKTLNQTIGKYINFWEYRRELGNWKKTFESIYINLQLLDRPFTNASVPIHKAMEFVIENPDKCSDLRWKIANALVEWSNSNTLVKDKKLVIAIRDGLGVSSFKDKLQVNGYIDENSMLDLIIYLFNKTK